MNEMIVAWEGDSSGADGRYPSNLQAYPDEREESPTYLSKLGVWKTAIIR
jgi:hypothetical protein